MRHIQMNGYTPIAIPLDIRFKDEVRTLHIPLSGRAHAGAPCWRLKKASDPTTAQPSFHWIKRRAR
jgi:hypothetical protein